MGKSEFTWAFVGETGVKKFEEPYQENPYLPDFYTKSREDNSFNSQMYFLVMKALQMQTIRGLLQSEAVIQDPAIDVDFMIANAHRKMGWMTDKEHFTYNTVSGNVTKDLTIPDVYIALTASKQTIGQRIIKRGREMELVMLKESPEYFDFLNDEFNDWLAEARVSKNIVVIDTDNFGISGDPDDMGYAVEEAKNWTGYYLSSDHQMNLIGSDGAKLIFPSFLRPRVHVKDDVPGLQKQI